MPAIARWRYGAVGCGLLLVLVACRVAGTGVQQWLVDCLVSMMACTLVCQHAI
jgi:hypothetical protein